MIKVILSEFDGRGSSPYKVMYFKTEEEAREYVKTFNDSRHWGVSAEIEGECK